MAGAPSPHAPSGKHHVLREMLLKSHTRSLIRIAVVVACVGCDDAPAVAYPRLALAPWVRADSAGAATWEDTAWKVVVPEIAAAWREYLVLASAGGAGASKAATRWSAEERARWPQYDLARQLGAVADHADGVVTDIRPARPGDTREYVIKTLFSVDGGRTPVALMRVHALRENGRWVFANALPRLTADWRRETVGPITYVIQPGYAFSHERARRAVAFADSLAAAYGAPPIDAITYYVTSTPDELLRIVGLDWAVTPGGRGGGWAPQVNRLIFSGDPLLGEEYRHELAHYAVAPLIPPGAGQWITSEGFATWLGGTAGRDYPDTMRAYARYLRAHPGITLDSVLEVAGPDARPSGALLMQMAFEKGGTGAVKELLRVGEGPAALKSVLERIFGQPWPAIAAAWRLKAEGFQ